ncbi:uncharacterized protein LOC105380630 isoform X1 [Plutella xylostella]|uniref:uncharacterized protein LOC105380630 isoform X1 n=1 Tax=Plutella xylostella TaxID=51655 RepID=UPI0020325F82|nr:uncharacterized protein LOC105380630 isoform X1 [Plutella xylostella]
MSLNDIQFKGTISQDKITNILLRFRKHKYIVIADVAQMYKNIYVREDQRHLQCILWRETQTDPLLTYKLTSLSFGLKCAPYIATRCLTQLANENKGEYPLASAAIQHDFLMDDYVHGDDDERRLAETSVQVDRILSTANFKLRKWKSNSKTILNEVSHSTTHDTYITTPIGQDNNNTHKVLGIVWDNNEDRLSYRLKREPMSKSITKRYVLSIASSIYDPLGMLGPVIIIAKCFIHKLFKLKFNWDEKLPIQLINEWETFYNSLFTLDTLSIPRRVVINDYITIEMHGFSDSSLTAYGAVIYIRSIDKQGRIMVRLLRAKSRVAREETIPRLELRAAWLLAALSDDVNNALKFKWTKQYFWSDSNVVLAWIKSPLQKLNTFVKNKVNDIQKITNIDDWRWVSSGNNSADLLSRGLAAERLGSSSLWWQGPSWLSEPIEKWPTFQLPKTEITLPETEQETHCNISTNKSSELITNLIKKYSNLNKLNRVFVYMRRFIHNSRHPNNRIVGVLSVDEMRHALLELIRFAQTESFQMEYKLLKNSKQLPQTSNILCLKPFMENGIIRVGGRLEQSSYNYDKKHPILLHHSHTLTILIMRGEHIRLMHAGPQLLLSSVRERYWPTHGKIVANKVVRECITCFRNSPKIYSPIMGNLPRSRVTPAPPFLTTGIDYAGPFAVRDKRGRGYRSYKCYIAIFICFSTKAIHLELVSGLETQLFLSALRRFTSRRGIPKTILQQIQCDFWRRWSRDYIGLLQERTKWRSCKGAGLDVGTIVLIKDDRLPPCQWRLGRIVGCCPGRDGITRVAEMRTARGIIKRAFNNICPLPITC